MEVILKIGEETIIQIQIVEWLKQTQPHIPVIHIANERKCHPMYGKILKRMGVMKDVVDLFMPRDNGAHCGLWLEIKKPGKKPTLGQFKFMEDRKAEGYAADWVDNKNDGIELISAFYGRLIRPFDFFHLLQE